MKARTRFAGVAALTAVALGCAIYPASSADEIPPPRPKVVAEATTEPYDSATKGALQVKGDTADWFNVHLDGKSAGPKVPPRLGSVAELAPGTYEVFVNKTKREVTVRAGEKTILLTGTLVVEGKGDWYTPYQGKEAKLAGVQPTLGSPVALFAGTYSVTVQVGTKSEKLTDDAQVAAGQKTVLKR